MDSQPSAYRSTSGPGGSRQEFGKRVYETEKARCARVEVQNRALKLDREVWGHTQTGPRHLKFSPRTETNFRIKNFAARTAWSETIGDFILSDVRLPYKHEPACEEIRSTTRCAPPALSLPSHARRRFDHSKSARGVWDRPPVPTSTVEPFIDVGKYMLHGRDLPRPHAKRGGGSGGSKSARTRITHISPDVYNQLRSKLKAAAYTGHKGRQIDVLFKRCDKDGTGSLEEDELRLAFRRVLKIPPEVLSDADVATAFIALDADGSGAVSIQELIDFIGPEPVASKTKGNDLSQVLDSVDTANHSAGVSSTG